MVFHLKIPINSLLTNKAYLTPSEMHKIKFLLSSIIIGALSICSSLFANYETFTDVLQQAGIDVTRIGNQANISRFEMTRLLNAIQCENCIVPPSRMLQRFTTNFWTDFSSFPNRDFQDISYGGARRNNQSYYYCVAYVADQEYMRGYPLATSPLCGGKFCGQNAITKPEFFQAILNIITTDILVKYQADRSAIKSWLNGLSTSSYQYQVLAERDIQAIRDASTQSKTLSNTNEFQAYLKYCMFNLKEC